MKRAVPQDVNSVPFSVLDTETAEEHPRQTFPEANRTVRTSAAMLGLAFSVGAYGLAAPQQAEAATPTEPATSDLTPSTSASADAPTASELTAVASPASTTTYTVQEGQTLWKIAELYGIDAAKLANMNGLQTTAVLSVGQTLQVPAANRTAISGVPIQSLPDLKAVPVIPPQASAPQSVSSVVVKRKQTALEGLKQNRDRLKQSLAELKSEEPSKSQSIPTQAVATMPQTSTPNLAAYRVNPGETLSSIAQAHGISSRDLAELNRLSNPNLVQANQFIKVPQKIAQVLPQPLATAQPQASTVAEVQLPTVPSLASTQNPSVPLAVGGDARQIAFANPSRNRSLEAQPVDVRRNDDQYVNTLLSDISRLRERYQARSANRQAPRAAVSEAPSRRVNPQFSPNRPVAALRTESRRAATPSGQTRLERMLADAPKPKSQVVATATLGSESYTPILRSSVGKTVSPNLPPLGRSDAYVPGDRFKGYMWPAKGMLTSPYGWRWGRMHKGIDIAAPVGTPIMAAASGKVITAGWNDGGYGNLVEVQHADGSVTLYAHNSRLLVRVGQQVRQGQQIAEMGSTGFSTGPHSHFEVHLPGRGAVNPIAMLPQSRS